jgi:hypothetical protein
MVMFKFVLVLLTLAAAWYWWAGQNENQADAPMPVEDTFIGDQVRALDKAKGFESEYLDATDAQKQKMEEQLQRAEGGG